MPTSLPGPAAYAAADVVELLDALRDCASADGDPAWVAAMSDLLVDAAVRALRERGRGELLDAALALGEFLATPIAASYDAALVATWHGVLEMLGRAGAATDQAAVRSILRSHQGKAGRVLEVLASRDGPTPRAELKRELAGISESHLSHVLRDLEEARLVVRERAGGREIVVSLTPRGRDAVGQDILPGWLDDVRDALSGQLSVDVDRLADRLRSGGISSDLAARRLAELVAPPMEIAGAMRRLIDEESTEHPRVASFYARGERPVGALRPVNDLPVGAPA